MKMKKPKQKDKAAGDEQVHQSFINMGWSIEGYTHGQTLYAF